MTVRLAHLSDIHFGAENVAATQAAIDVVCAFGPSLVIVTGDLTRNGAPDEFIAARAWLEALPPPLLVTPGNHDTPYWNIPLRALVPFNRYRRYIGPPDHGQFETPDLSAHAINTARGAQPRPNWSHGAISVALVETVAAAMAAAGEALKVLACHHPLIELEGAPVGSGVRRGNAAAQALARAGADLILTGHLHTPFARALPYGDANTYACGAGTLSVRTRGTPESFSLIEADRTTIGVTVQAWAGSTFEPAQSWTLPRRAAADGEGARSESYASR